MTATLPQPLADICTVTDGSRPDILSSPIRDARITGVEMDGKLVFKTMVR